MRLGNPKRFLSSRVREKVPVRSLATSPVPLASASARCIHCVGASAFLQLSPTPIGDLFGLGSHPFPLLHTDHHKYTHRLSGMKSDKEILSSLPKVVRL